MFTKMRPLNSLYILFIFLIASCGGDSETDDQNETIGKEEMYFEVVSGDKSGIHFSNNLVETDTFSYLNFQYMYNGGGVAVGDINNDGLCDIYFTGNQVDDKLYLNKGDLKFEDITDQAIGKLAGSGWHTGVTMADVNADGFLDIYVCRSGLGSFGELLKNLLFINNGNNTFSEKGAEYGIDVDKGSNQAAFFDMDNDGDLDLYVMNKPFVDTKNRVYNDLDLSAFPFTDMLFENVDGQFVDITASAGILNNAYGLGIAVSDIDQDGFQDIYISNDYTARDYLYMNQGDKTFKEEIRQRTQHLCQFSMGNDIADFNNDGLVDIANLDMVSEDHVTSKQNMGGMNPDLFWATVEEGNHYQYMFNVLQLNNGNGTFSDIAQMAGIAKTDWSWAPLFADFDNDGFKDLFITNGYRRDVRHSDYAKYLESRIDELENFKEILDEAPLSVVPNYFFKNSGDLKFDNVNANWKMDIPVNSNGAAYADLDLDGDLDLVVNNMEEESFILENKLKSNNHYLRVKADRNYDGLKVTLKTGDRMYYQEMHPTRGFQSSMEYDLHFGLGDLEQIDELTAVFNDGKVFKSTAIKTDQTFEIKYSEAVVPPAVSMTEAKPLFSKVALIDFKHQELFVNDFTIEVLLPHKMSQLGPFMSHGDIDGNGLEDFYLSGSRYFAGTLFIQKEKDKFTIMAGPGKADQEHEELGSLFFDIENDGDLDLYVISGSNEHTYNSPMLEDRLYVNDGKGHFTDETKKRLPPMITSGQRLCAGDIDGDGDLDLFIGGRQIPGFYPFAYRSFLLQNNDGIFTEITGESPDLIDPGMITQSIFDDFDQDGDLDLICVGEWMPISFYENKNGKFTDVTELYGLSKSVGWWMSISSGDFNGDGINDYVVGNTGENNKFHPTTEDPLECYVEDFDGNGTYDIVLGEYQNGSCYPVRGRSCSSQQMPFILDKFPTYADFAKADLEDIYGPNQLDSALHFSATTLSSVVLLSNGSGYDMVNLPSYAQMGPLNAGIVKDFDKDGNLDFLGVGNNFAAEIETVRYDGGRGVLLLGDGKGGFRQLAPQESGFFVNTDAKDMILLGDLIIVSSNNDKLKVFRF